MHCTPLAIALAYRGVFVFAAPQFESANAGAGWIFYMSVIIFLNAVFSSLFLCECVLKIVAFGPRVQPPLPRHPLNPNGHCSACARRLAI